MASLAFSPVFALQGRWVRRVARRLPEPPGPRAGVRGSGPPLRLLIVGDSAAAGVGAPSQEEALSGRLVGELASSFRVRWALVARAGASTSGTARHLAKQAAGYGTFDLAVLSLGTNDLTAHRPLDRWVVDVAEVVDLLRTRFTVQHILLSALPPLHLFTAFPQPLRWYLGATARRFDRALANWAAGQPDCEHVPIPLESARGLLAQDGLHPGPELYERWSGELAPRIRARWAPPPLAQNVR